MATSIETVTDAAIEDGVLPSVDRIPLPRIIGYGIGDFGFNFYWFSLSCSCRTTTPTCSACAAKWRVSSSSSA